MAYVKERYFVFWIAIVGLLISLLISYPVWQSDLEHRKNVFDYRVAGHAVMAQQALAEMLEQMHYLETYIRTEYVLEGGEDITQSGFDHVIRLALYNEQVAPHFLAWANRTDDNAGIYTIRFSSHDGVDGIFKGMDIDENPDIHVLMRKASGLGRTVVGLSEDKPNLVKLLMPVYDSLQMPANVADRRKHVLGYIMGHWDIKNILENSFSLLPVAGMDVYLADVTQNPEHIFYQHLSRSRMEPFSAEEEGLVARKDFNLADRSWRLYFKAAPGFYDHVPLQRTWQTLLACLAVTLFLVVGLAALRSDRAALQGLMAEEKLRADLKVSEAQKDKLNLEIKIQHTDRLESLGVMAGGIAHDFNNILTAILGNAGLARTALADSNPKISKYMRAIEGSSLRAADLCKQMLAYSGQGHFIIEAVDLSSEILDIQDLLQSSVAKKVVIDYQLQQPLPAIRADKTQMHQIMMNLIINASEAIESTSKAAGRVTVSTGLVEAEVDYFAHFKADTDLPAGTYAFLEISDDGCGMDEATIAKVYDPFFTTKFIGRGLGMSAILGIVRGHKGAIHIYSELKHGTVFRLLFPCADLHVVVPENPSIVQDDQVMIEQFGQGRTVLVIDDEKIVRQLIEGLLGRMGFKVLQAVDGQHGLQVFRQHQADIALVVLDYAMPVMDGFECFSELKGLQDDVRVLLSSGYNEADATQRFSSYALAGFIQKPYLIHAFEHKVIEILADSV